ncbi:hypothetical protein, partial [Streptomyces sp. NPDC006333]
MPSRFVVERLATPRTSVP